MATDWISDLAADARRRAGVGDYPTTRDLLRLAELTGSRLVHAAVPSPYYFKTGKGPIIVLPLSWRGEEHDEELAHEVAHSLLSPGGGNLIRFLWPDSPRHERLARLWDSRDEEYADAFARAWFGRDST